MGFFTDLKEDLNQAVNELLPDADMEEQEAEDASQQPVNLEEMLQNMSDFEIPEELEETAALEETDAAEQEAAPEEILPAEQPAKEETPKAVQNSPAAPQSAPSAEADLEKELRATFGAPAGEESTEGYSYPESAGGETLNKDWMIDLSDMELSDETAVITSGMKVNGDLVSNGSADVNGEVNGNVQVKGKLSITGRVTGNARAQEIFADAARISGDLISDGTIKIAAGAVVRGNVESASAAIAGAVKGNIDVRGPVILDATAVVLGNIRAKSMQINNGARIEGMCMLCYAEQSAAKFFESQESM